MYANARLQTTIPMTRRNDTQVRGKDAALAKAGFAVMQAVPSCTIATDMNSALLHILPPRHHSGAAATIQKVTSSPAGAISFGKPASVGSNGCVREHYETLSIPPAFK